MKKVLFACSMLLCLHSLAFAAASPPLLSFTIDNVFTALEKASTDSDFLFDASGAEKSCDAACVSKLKVDTDTYVLVTYAKDSGLVTNLALFTKVAYEEKDAVANGILRAATALAVLSRCINPKISSTDLEKLQKRVGILSDGLIKGEKANEVTYKGVSLTAVFTSGAYIVGAKAASKK